MYYHFLQKIHEFALLRMFDKPSIFFYVCLLTYFSSLLICAQEQVSAESQDVPKEATSTHAGQNEIRAQIDSAQSRLEEIKRQLEDLATLESAALEGSAEIGIVALQARSSALRKIQAALQKRISALRGYESVLERSRALEAQAEQFQHLSEKPPYTIAFLDTLLDVVDTKRTEIETAKASLKALAELVTMEKEDIPLAKAAFNRVGERLRSATPENQRFIEFEIETARLLVEANEAEFHAAEVDYKRMEAYIALLETDRNLAQRKATLARSKTLFRTEELDGIEKQQEAVIAGLEEEIKKANSEIENIRAKLPRAEQNLEQQRGETDTQKRMLQELELLRLQLEATEIRLTILESLREFEKSATRLWTLRFEVANPSLAENRPDWDAIAAELRDHLDVFTKERIAGEQRAVNLRAQIAALERKMEEAAAKSNEKRMIQEQLNVLAESVLMRNRMQLRVGQLIRLSERILAEVRARQSERSITEVLKSVSQQALGMITLWFDRELGVIGGESITGRKLFYMVLILVVGLLLSRLVTRYIQYYALERLKLRSNMVFVIAKLTNYALFLIVVYIALNYVNIPLTIFTFLGGALALGVGFGAQNLINNFLSGLILMGEQPIRLGDIVEIEGKLGVITNIGARASRLRMFNGFDLLIPNSKFLETSVINWTLSDSKIRLQVEVGVAYGTPTHEAAALIMRAVTEHSLVLKEPEPKVLFEAFGDNALHFSVYFWIELGPTIDGRVVMSDIRHRIDALFREAGITIAFPQRDIHLETLRPLEVCLVGKDNSETADANQVR